MTKRLQALNMGFLLLFGLVVLALLYWGVWSAPGLLARDDNPRLVEAELRVQRGSILDRDGVVLAETVGELGNLERQYNGMGVYSPAVGYYSLRYGVSGIESTYDAVLRGRVGVGWRVWWEDLLHRDPVGRDVRLTLDAEAQAAADLALGENRGAVVLLDARTGEILALVSHPNYDPNVLDEEFETLNADQNAPLLNRPTQALYQPGTALAPLVLAAALELGEVQLDDPADDLRTPVAAGDSWLDCLSAPLGETGTITTALVHSCPSPFAALGVDLGVETLEKGLGYLGLFDSPPVPLEVAPSTRPDSGDEGEMGNGAAAAEAVGQGQLTLSPLQMAWALAAIANEGEIPPLRLVRRVGDGELVVPATMAVGGVSPEMAAAVTQVMIEGVVSGAARAAAIENVLVAGHLGAAVAGPGGLRNSWFLGFAPATMPEQFARYLVVVVIEEAVVPGGLDPAAAARVGGGVLRSMVEDD